MKALKIVAVVTGILTLAQLAFLFLFKGAGSVGIIGGSDGPTAIFLAPSPTPAIQYTLLIICALTAVTATAVVLIRKR